MGLALTIEHLEVFYGQFQALFDIHLSVEEGQTVAIIGANGAGKTTLLRTICGSLKSASGTIRFREQLISNQPAYTLAAQGIVMVPEGRKLFPSLSVEENLNIGSYSGRTGYWTLEKIYQTFPVLQERKHHRATQLSGGQQQMVAIGRALMANPTLLLMDELSLGLAPIVVNELYEVIRQVSKQGTTVILVEQDVNRGLKEASYVYCLLEGKLSLSGVPQELQQEAISRAYFGV
jgi:branched-chain amino acid transport system ATP-binding protein